MTQLQKEQLMSVCRFMLDKEDVAQGLWFDKVCQAWQMQAVHSPHTDETRKFHPKTICFTSVWMHPASHPPLDCSLPSTCPRDIPPTQGPANLVLPEYAWNCLEGPQTHL